MEKAPSESLIRKILAQRHGYMEMSRRVVAAVAKDNDDANAQSAQTSTVSAASTPDLAEHDKRFHGGVYKGGKCKYREDRGIPTTPAPEGMNVTSTGEGEESVSEAEENLESLDKTAHEGEAAKPAEPQQTQEQQHERTEKPQEQSASADEPKYRGRHKEDEGVRSYTTKAENRGTAKNPDWHEVKSVKDKKGNEKSTKNTHDAWGKKGKHDKWFSLPTLKDKPPTPNLDSFGDVPAIESDTLSQIDESLLYLRADKPIEYGEGEGEGKPRYQWTKGGNPVPEEEALRLEGALREKYSQGLQSMYTNVRVRPDLKNGYGQVMTYVDKDGEGWQKYSDSHIYAAAICKYHNVTRLLPHYGEIKERIQADCEAGKPEAMLAYFMQRTKIRAGSDTKAKAGLGATNLTRGNFSLSDDGETVYVSFNGKSKQWWHVTLKDKVLFDYIKKRKDELAEQGEGANAKPLFPVPYKRLCSYLKSVSIDLVGGDAREAFCPHDFRRLGATKVALDYLQEHAQGVDPIKDEKKWQDRVVKAVVAAAQHLNDEPSTVFENYIAPNLLFSNSKETMLHYFPFLKGVFE